jgi:hypothetical protein
LLAHCGRIRTIMNISTSKICILTISPPNDAPHLMTKL